MHDILTAPVLNRIAAHLGSDAHALRGLLAPPAKGFVADVALPCFQPAKAAGVAPPVLAAQLAELLTREAAVPGLTATAVGPFLNLAFAPATANAALVPIIAADGAAALRSASGRNRRLCLDFSSPNIAKHLAFHHIRSTMLGNSLSRLYAACGWQVTRINFLGDWGTAFGRLISGWTREGLSEAELSAAPDKVTFLNALYVRASAAAKDNPALEEDARLWSKRLEDGDATARHLWQLFKDASLAEFRRVYDLLGVAFDSWNGEAFYNDKMEPVLNELAAKQLSSIDQGALIVDLPVKLGKAFKKPALLRRADGGTLYATRDLAACDDRHRAFAFDRSLYVVDLGQSLHFQEWFAIARLLQRPYAEHLRHVGFGIVLMWNDEPGEGLEPGWAKGRTRNGKVMLLREVLEEAIERADAVIREKNPELGDSERAVVARQVGIGAVVFNDLKSGRTNDVKFKFEDALRFDGETGPYVQYAHARLCSIERKAGAPRAGNPALLIRDDEKQVTLSIVRLTNALERAVENDEPSILAQALLTVAGAVSSWLSAGSKDPSARVLGDDAELSAARLLMVRAARIHLAEGLRLLGLEAPERM